MEKIYLDLDYLKDLSGGDREFIIEILESFLLNTPASIEEMQKAYSEKEWGHLRMAAHKAKSSCQFVGSHILQDSAVKIEELCMEGVSDTNGLFKLIEKFKEAYSITKDQIDHEIAQLKS